ncbi:MAG TPA: phage tail protein [Candidatus Binataceae bacterium]
MFAVLGEIQFKVIGSPESLKSNRSYRYAEQEIVQDKPRLQWLSSGLERLALNLMLHASFSNPALQLALLGAAGDAHQALPLVLGSGEFRGLFVIESIATQSTQLSATGDPIAIEAQLVLKEWAPDSELGPTAPPVAPFVPLGIIEDAITGAGAQPAASSAPTNAPVSAASPRGISVLLQNPASSGPPLPDVQASDIPVAAIVRTVSL